MSLSFGPLAIVEGSGDGAATQAGKGGLVEEVLQGLVASAHPFVVAGLFTGIVGGRHQTSVGSEVVGALEGREITSGDQKLGTKVYADSRDASEDLSFLAGEKTLSKLPVEGLDALLERESTSPASSATIRALTSPAGGVTLRDLAAVVAF